MSPCWKLNWLSPAAAYAYRARARGGSLDVHVGGAREDGRVAVRESGSAKVTIHVSVRSCYTLNLSRHITV